MESVDTHTLLCAVIGKPVGHSLSPAIHNAAFAERGLNYVYLAFEVKDVGACLRGMRALKGFRGLSVTIPHKLEVMAHLDEVDAMAAGVGSVNTVTNEAGRLVGSTTDGPGALRAFEAAEVELEGKRVLFLGAGGAVRAVAFAVSELARPSAVTILGRTASRVDILVSDLAARKQCAVEGGDLVSDLEKAMATHDVVIQGTPVGMYPEHEGRSCVPADLLRPEQVVFDMVYRPSETCLVRDAEAAGCTVVRGTEMLLHQAALQFECWTGEEAPLEAMRAALAEGLARDSGED